MAYSNYGAFIWKNGKNVTDKYADTGFIWKGKKFVKETDKEAEEEYIRASGHAVIPLGNFCIEFYKTFNPKIIYSSGNKKEINVFDIKDYKNTRLSLKISGYSLDAYNSINVFEIKHKEDVYYVICGNCVGNGYDDNNVSQYLLKNVKYDKEEKFYWIEDGNTDITTIIDKLSRLDEIDHEKYWLKRYRKDFWKSLLKFKIQDALWDLDQMRDHKEHIKWLK